MEIPLQITFRDVAPSAAVEARIRERVAELERFYDRIMHCHVCVQAPHRRRHQGTLFHVRIDLTVPGDTVVVNRTPAADHAHEDVYVAIRDAFDAARRQLEDIARRQRGATKVHELPPVARVAKLFPEQDYGFITTPDGREIYFHRNSVVNVPFDRLEVGREVEFVEEAGEKGPQATTVRVTGSP
jgi:ribosomal subunit interface protein